MPAAGIGQHDEVTTTLVASGPIGLGPVGTTVNVTGVLVWPTATVPKAVGPNGVRFILVGAQPLPVSAADTGAKPAVVTVT